MGCFVVTEFLLTSTSRGPSAIAEPLVNFALLNSEVTAPIFTEISHDVEALVQLHVLSINPCIYKTMLHFVSKEQRVKTVNFDV